MEILYTLNWLEIGFFGLFFANLYIWYKDKKTRSNIRINEDNNVVSEISFSKRPLLYETQYVFTGDKQAFLADYQNTNTPEDTISMLAKYDLALLFFNLNNENYLNEGVCACITFHHEKESFRYQKIIIGGGEQETITDAVDACLSNFIRNFILEKKQKIMLQKKVKELLNLDIKQYQDLEKLIIACENFNNLSTSWKQESIESLPKNICEALERKFLAKGGRYENDLFAFIAFGTMHQHLFFEILDLEDNVLNNNPTGHILTIEERFKPNDVLKIGQFFNNNGISDILIEDIDTVEKFLNEYEIDGFGTPRNWGKFIIAIS